MGSNNLVILIKFPCNRSLDDEQTSNMKRFKIKGPIAAACMYVRPRLDYIISVMANERAQ